MYIFINSIFIYIFFCKYIYFSKYFQYIIHLSVVAITRDTRTRARCSKGSHVSGFVWVSRSPARPRAERQAMRNSGNGCKP